MHFRGCLGLGVFGRMADEPLFWHEYLPIPFLVFWDVIGTPILLQL